MKIFSADLINTTSETQTQGNNSTKVATTAYVDTGLATKISTTLPSAKILVGNASNIATPVDVSGDATMDNAGALTVGANKITYAKFQQIPAYSLVGNAFGSNNNTQAIGLGASIVMSGTNLVRATLSGDVSAPQNSNTLTLTTVNSNVGSFGSATQTTTFTVNGKGLITAAGQTTITPAVSSITGLGTGVTTALAINVGTAGSPVVNGGALGTPSSGVATNLTGLPLTTGVTGLLPDGNIASATNWNNAYTNRITSLTTTGSSGAATLTSNTLNIPNYTLAGLGGTTLAAVNAQNLSVFAATTSAQIASVISDETGSGALVFANAPTLTGTFNFASATGSGTFTLSSLTAGSVIFAGTAGLISQDNANYFWDNTNKRLCLGTAISRQRITIGTTISTSTATPECIDLGGTLSNSAGNNLKILTYNDGTFRFGIGVSAGSQDYVIPTGSFHTFYGGSLKLPTLTGSAALGLNGSNTVVSVPYTYGQIFGTGNPSIATSTETELTAAYWNGSAVTNGTVSFSAGRWTVSSAGFYDISVDCSFALNATGFRGISIARNGSLLNRIGYETKPAVALDRTGLSTSGKIYLNSGDYVSVYVFQTSGGNLAMDVNVNGNFSISKEGGI